MDHQVQQPARLLKVAPAGLSLVLALCAVALPGPAGCSIAYVQAEGDRLIPEIGGGEHCRRVLIADLRTGGLLGQFQFPRE